MVVESRRVASGLPIYSAKMFIKRAPTCSSERSNRVSSAFAAERSYSRRCSFNGAVAQIQPREHPIEEWQVPPHDEQVDAAMLSCAFRSARLTKLVSKASATKSASAKLKPARVRSSLICATSAAAIKSIE